MAGESEKPGTAEQVGRPEGGGGGVPIPSEPPSSPKPPELPDPQPGRPDPIPKTAAPPSLPMAQPLHLVLDVSGSRQAVSGSPVALPQPLAPQRPEPAPDKPHPGKPAPPQSGRKPGESPEAGASSQPGADTGAPPVPGEEPRAGGNAIYRIDPDGFVTEVFRQNVLVLSLLEQQGTLLVATGSEGLIYQVNPAAEETIVLAKVDPKEVMCLLAASDGQVYLGMANVGGLAAMSSGFAEEGTYTSPVLDASQVSRFGKVRLQGSLPAGTSLKMSTRSGNVREPGEAGWSKWSDPVPAVEFLQTASPSARFLQYRLSFASEAGKRSPVVDEVDVAYEVPNLAPQVKSVRIAVKVEPAQPDPQAAAANDQPANHRMQTITWEATDPNDDSLLYSLHFRSGVSAPWILLKDKLKEAEFQWDTHGVADGPYQIRVTASDAAANPKGQGRIVSRVSDPVVVDNTAPIIGDLKWQAEGKGIRIDLKVIDRTSTIKQVEYSVDSNDDWQAVDASDSIFDSPEEAVGFAVPDLPAGPHQVTLRATDARGNQVFQNVLVKTQGAPAEKKD